jgi:hypothetical protein
MAAIININGTRYRLPLEIADITLRRHLAIVEAEATAPKAYLDLFNEQDPIRSAENIGLITEKVYIGKLIPYFARVIEAATDIPTELLLGKGKYEGAPPAMIESWYHRIQQCYLDYQEIKDDYVSEWELDGQIWALPEKHMSKATFGEYAEAAQYEESVNDLKQGKWAAMPYVMAVLLRPKGEKFDPDTFDAIVEERKEFMLELGMDVVLQTAFFLQRLNDKSAPDLLIYTTAREVVRQRQRMN